MFLKSNTYISYQSHLKNTLQHTEDMKSCCSNRSSVSLEDNIPLMERSSPEPTIQRTESKLNLFEESNLEDFWFKPLSSQSHNRFVKDLLHDSICTLILLVLAISTEITALFPVESYQILKYNLFSFILSLTAR